MDREIKLENYLPEFVAELEEMKVIMECLNPKIEELYANLELTLNVNFIRQCDTAGIERYEKMLGIAPNPLYTLEDRKFVVLSYFNCQMPYTKLSLKDKLETLCGKDCVSIEYPEAGVIKVRLGLKAKNMYESARAMLETILPANLVLDYSLLWNQHKTLRKFQHKELAKYTHRMIREEVLS